MTESSGPSNSSGCWRHALTVLCGLSLLTVMVNSPLHGAEEDAMAMRLGGCGGVYFYAPEGPFWVEVQKQDLNIRNTRTHLRALLVGPDRSVVDQAWIGDDGKAAASGPGPVQRVLMRTNVERPGVYGLNITVTQDRYGDNISWGFRTNCPKYFVETSRGHRDARHEEPIVLRNAGVPGDVGFMPPSGPFSIDVSGLTRNVKELPIFDGDGRRIITLSVSPERTARGNIPAESSRKGTLWRLHLSDAQAVIRIDGVTRWERGGAWENLSLWTPDLSSWFPFHENRWLLTPYSRNVYADTGAEGTINFTLHNNGSTSKRVGLSLEFEENAAWSAELPKTEVELAPDSSAQVPLSYKVPSDGAEWKCYARASVLDETRFSTWSSVTLRRGVAPAQFPVSIPLKLEPYRHENEQFGYLPEYPLDNQVYFDIDNRPFIISNDGVFALRNNAWAKTTTARRADSKKTVRIRPLGTKIAFDRENDVYFLGRDGGTTLLFHSRDHGENFNAWPVPGSGSFDIEQFSGHNLTGTPPPLARFHQTARDPKLIWRRINDLDLILPAKKPDGSIVMGRPVAVSKKCIGLSAHSGIPSTIVSRKDKVHITWGQATPPQEKKPGVPTYVTTYDRSSGRLGSPVLVGYGPPANDVHNSPCITMDSNGYLHVLIGTHGRTFKYVRSLSPNSSSGGWTPAEDIGPGLRQTYVGMVCDHDNVLHLVFRLWLSDNKYFPASHYANLAYMRKLPQQKWSDARPLVVAPFSEYSIFYHRITIDRKGALFLSYDYWSTFWFYRTDHRGSRRALLMSRDGGNAWKLASSDDFLYGVPYREP
ncbi:MAG: BNR-4 repeat-containing protein [Phycisphaerales bacterium]|nr:MAG: BNR-4 repeat-containing protein [Phycisphaerales bacterium]